MVGNALKKYSRAAGDLSQVKNVEAIRMQKEDSG
jgi:hypothetical protein